jgi:hypothetical protein
MIKIFFGLHAKYPLLFSDFNETWGRATNRQVAGSIPDGVIGIFQ